MNPNFIRVRRACTATYRAIRDALRAFEESWADNTNDSDEVVGTHEPLDVPFDDVFHEALDRLPRHGIEERLLRDDLWAMTLMLRYDRTALEFAIDLGRHVRRHDVRTLRELVETYLVPLHNVCAGSDQETVGNPLRFEIPTTLEYRFGDAGLYTAFRVCAFPTWSVLDCTGLVDPQSWLRFSTRDDVQRTIESHAREHYWPALRRYSNGAGSVADDDDDRPVSWQDFAVDVDEEVFRKSPRAADDQDRSRHPARTPNTSPDFDKLASGSPAATSPIRLRKRFPRLLLGGDVKFGYSPRPSGANTPSPRQSPTVTSGFAAALQLAMDMESPRVSPRNSALRPRSPMSTTLLPPSPLPPRETDGE